MHSHRLLDDLVFASPPLRLDRIASPIQPKLTLGIGGSSRKLQLSSPWFIREAPPQQLAASWPEFCGLLRSHGIAMFCKGEQLDKLAAASIPVRFSRRRVDQPFSPLELRTADALELDGESSDTDRWGWPPELGELERLPTLIQAIRDATANTVPIGLSLPIGACNADLNWCVQAAVDFVTLVEPAEATPAAEAVLVEGLVRARERFDAAQLQSLPILMVTQLRNTDSALKLIALGASAVCIDRLVHQHLEDPRPDSAVVSSGMLGGIHAPASLKVSLHGVEQVLAALNRRLESWLHSQDVREMQAWRGETLRGLSEQVCQLARVEPLHEPRS